MGVRQEWIFEITETEMPSSSQKKKMKVGEIFSYRACTVCSQENAGLGFSIGKKRNGVEFDCLKRHSSLGSKPTGV
jgi:hypothetical protein